MNDIMRGFIKRLAEARADLLLPGILCNFVWAPSSIILKFNDKRLIMITSLTMKLRQAGSNPLPFA